MFNGGDAVKYDALAMIACVLGPFIGSALAAFTWKLLAKKEA